MVWAFALTSLAGFMVTLDNLVVTTALPGHPPRPRREPRRPRVDGQRLHAHLRRPAPRPAPRSATGSAAPAAARDRARRSSRSPRRRQRSRPSIGALDAAARPAGHRRCDRDAADPDDPLRLGSGRAPRARARRVGRDHRPRGRVRAARRRRRCLGDLVAVDLLAQRPDRGRARPARPATRLDESRGDSGRLDLPGLVLAGVGLLGVVWGLVRGNSRRLGLAGDRRCDRCRRGACCRAFVWWETRTPTPMLPMRFFRDRAFALSNTASLFFSFGMFGSIFLLGAVLPDGPGLFAARLGPADPAVDGDADDRRPDRRGTLRPDRRAPADGGQGSSCRPSGSRGSRRSRRRPCPTSTSSRPFALRHRDGALLRARHERRALVRPPRGAGTGLGRQQHDPRTGGVLGVAVLASIFAPYGGFRHAVHLRRRHERRRLRRRRRRCSAVIAPSWSSRCARVDGSPSGSCPSSKSQPESRKE